MLHRIGHYKLLHLYEEVAIRDVLDVYFLWKIIGTEELHLYNQSVVTNDIAINDFHCTMYEKVAHF